MKKFKAAAQTVTIGQRLQKATGGEMSVEARTAFNEDTVELPSIDQIMAQRRRRGFHASGADEQD